MGSSHAFLWILVITVAISVAVCVPVENVTEATVSSEEAEDNDEPESKTDYVVRIRIKNRNANRNANVNEQDPASAPYKKFNPYHKGPYLRTKPSSGMQDESLLVRQANRKPQKSDSPSVFQILSAQDRVVNAQSNSKEKPGTIGKNLTSPFDYEIKEPSSDTDEDMPIIAIRRKRPNSVQPKEEATFDDVQPVSPDEFWEIVNSLGDDAMVRKIQAKESNNNITAAIPEAEGTEVNDNSTESPNDVYYAYEIMFPMRAIKKLSLPVNDVKDELPFDFDDLIHPAWASEKSVKKSRNRHTSNRQDIVSKIIALKNQAEAETLSMRIIGPPPYHPLYRPFEKLDVPYRKFNKRVESKL